MDLQVSQNYEYYNNEYQNFLSEINSGKRSNGGQNLGILTDYEKKRDSFLPDYNRYQELKDESDALKSEKEQKLEEIRKQKENLKNICSDCFKEDNK